MALGRRSLVQSLLAVTLLAPLAGASSAQQSSKTEARGGHGNPCDAANTQMEMTQFSADE
jgi:hypothetical protein